MNESLLTGLLVAAAFAAPATAQRADADGPGPGARLDLDLTLDAWRHTNGDNWHARAERTSGRLEMLYGGRAQAPFRPRDDSDWFQLARTFVQETHGMHMVHGGTLVDDRVMFLPLGQVNTTDKMTVRMRQEVGGVPVVGGYVNLLFTPEGDLLSIQNTALSLAPGTSTTPATSAGSAERSARDLFRRSQTVAPATVSEAELAFQRIDGRALLVWRVDVTGDDQAVAFKYVIDAQSGQLADRENLVHHFDVGGTVSTNATPGTLPDTGANPEVQVPLPLARVTSSAGTIFADANGNFNYPGVNGPLSVTVEYRGQYYRVVNNAGANHTVTSSVSGGGNSFLLNPASTGSETGAANAYMGSDATRNMIKSVNPGDTTADFVILSNVNLNDVCNAFYNGSSINFYPSGGGCVNTAYSTVVAHELGHWLNSLYGTGNGSDGMGEGNGDVFAMYTYDAPIVGRNFAGTGNHIRTGTNTRQYCGDGNGGCYGQVHADGEVWMGAAWKIRSNLKDTHGSAVGGMIANSIFMGWMNAYNQSTISSIIETQWLTLDDDDADLDNGTPNFGDIDAGFRQQGFPGIDLPAFNFISLTEVADTQDDNNPQAVSASVASTIGNTITGVTIRYRTNNGPLFSSVMSNSGGNNWQGSIPAQASPSLVEYYITATDSGANSQDFPGADVPLDYAVGISAALLVTDFEAAGTEGWTGGAAGDNATTGVWVRVNPIGTTAQPEDDHTAGAGNVRAWVTGQGSAGGALGENDVDGGTTTLLSPVFDGSTSTILPLSYYRWYSNNTGGEPNADVFVVGVSGNGGSTWTTLETVGPAGSQSNGGWFRHSVDLTAVITPTANMRLRFQASDLAGGSIVEAAVDDIQLLGINPSDGCLPISNYCVGGLNSINGNAMISVFGSQSVAANDVTLFAEQAPGDKFGLFFYGLNQGQVPFGDGFRCVTGSIFRLNPIVQTTNLGEATKVVDLTNPPAPGGQITPGSVWNFQFWYRDPMGPGGTGFNLTDAVEVPFCD